MTVFEKMTHQKPLPEEPYPTMHKDGYSIYDIRETAVRSIMRHKFEEMEAQAAAQESSPWDVSINLETREK